MQALYEYEYEYAPGKKQTVRAFYQTITTNSSNGYFETFMGDEGTLVISESASRGAVYREQSAPSWDKWVEKGYLKAIAKKETKAARRCDCGCARVVPSRRRMNCLSR